MKRYGQEWIILPKLIDKGRPIFQKIQHNMLRIAYFLGFFFSFNRKRSRPGHIAE